MELKTTYFVKLVACTIILLAFWFPACLGELESIGTTVEGKTYFADFNKTMNWTEAKAYCNASGLTLGTIETAVESYFLLNNLYGPTTIPGYWTAARESRLLTSLEWDNNGTHPRPGLMNFQYYIASDPYYYCGYVHVYLSNIHFFMAPCRITRRVLCQA